MSTDVEESVSQRPMISEEKVEEIVETNKRNQYLAGIAVSLGGFCAGTVLAWTSPALEFLIENEPVNTTNHTALIAPGFKISTTEEAAVGATLMLGGLLCAIPSGKCADLFGRKITLIIIALLYFASFVVIACANDVIMLVVARFFAGLALGGCCVVSPMYIGEIAEESIRGVLGSLFNVLLALGIVYTNLVGLFSNWVGLSILLAIPALLAAVAMIFLPDTPVYLMNAGRFGKARRSLVFFRCNEKIANEEFGRLQKRMTENEGEGALIDLFTKGRYRRPMIAGLGVFAYQQLCGINIVVFYLVPIFKAAGSAINPSFAATTTNVIALVVGVISVFVIEKRNRKYFLMISALSMLIGTVVLGLFFQLKDHAIDFPGLQMVPISCVVLFMAAFAIGLGPVPYILLIELYTPEIRGIASGVNIVCNWLSAFLVTFSYPYILKAVGRAWSFYLFGLLNGLGILFIWFVVPETRKKKEGLTQMN